MDIITSSFYPSILLAGFSFFGETFFVGLFLVYLAIQTHTLSKIAKTIAQQHNSIDKLEQLAIHQPSVANADFGIEIKDITATPNPSYQPNMVIELTGLTIVRKTMNITLDLKQLSGVQQIKILGEDGNVLKRDKQFLRFSHEQFTKSEASLYFSDDKREEPSPTALHASGIATSLVTLVNVGYYEYFFVLAEYHKTFQLYLIAKKHDEIGHVLQDFQVFGRYDLHALRYSMDKEFAELDRTMAAKYETIYKHYKNLEKMGE